MRLAKRGKGEPPPASGDVPTIESLPDGLLQHILGFMDARQAVRTCVLARRWRHLWQSATSLRFLGLKLAKVRAFMEHLLLLRTGSPLDTFELWFDAFRDSDGPRVNLWVRYALLCKVQVLKLGSSVALHAGFQLDDLRLVSQHLRVLMLAGVVLKNRTCDFSSCESLEHLDIVKCLLPCVRNISSKTLKFLSIRNCRFNQDQRIRTIIYAPSLVSLRLDDHRCVDEYFYRAPVLDSMPLLQNAFFRLIHGTADSCTRADSGNCGHDDCNSCYGVEDDNRSVLLEGLSEAENLSLIAESKTFIFKRDLKQCPTFSKLKTLLLNDYWCVAPDFHELNSILKHSPVLERLTLHLFSKGPKHKLRIRGSWNPAEISAAISDHLKIVEVKCEVINNGVVKLLKFISTFNIRFSLDEVEILEQ
ncbi:hypothetical protein BS78_05G104800 [Paspalum vaginatum]|uniref:F-box domain-containing protein n=1 Tax=Paspalum vaginatum TaxID=158149 RepID=A0A9W8CEZ0_9POAL|nr:hypothetical protein BS78_K172700 [Paspalum vaginatum]KAJ1255670.1 hypothetical protein BS78_K172700 [Paspalum vaginatum]KAJ1255671.1 hypothetical protein BS78_K172700 [Paspalum vaginatum]KAJ1275017.1 hypothetical protein BS78_05G104800 [Paspalum vaginatum]